MASINVVLEVLYKAGNFLAVTPLYDFKKNRLVYNIYYTVISSIVCIVFFIAPISVYFDVDLTEKFSPFGAKIVKSAIIIANLANGIITLTFILRKSLWQKLLSLLKDAEDIAISSKYESVSKQIYSRINIIILITMCGFLNIHSFFSEYYNISVVQMYLIYANTVLIFVLVLAWETCFTIGQHIVQINNYFESYSPNLGLILVKKDNTLITDIRKIRKRYRFICKSIKSYNKIFDVLYITFILSAIVTLLLCLVMTVSEIRKHNFDVDIIMNAAMGFFTCLVSY